MSKKTHLHCITLYYAQQKISWKPGKTSKFGPIHSTIQIWTDFHENEAKKKIQNGRFSKSPFSKIANSQNFFAKAHRYLLGLEELIDAKGIDFAQPIWP